MSDKAQQIAKLNDELRTTFNPSAGKVVLSQGVYCLPAQDKVKIFELVQNFNDFSENNDPYGEHDIGSVDHNGNKVFWKIDYYDTNLEYHSEDPADPNKTNRVMTIILANEY
ncbi:MAG: DUF3768 domain-containing protein [Saprospiraceae bacterium]|jgi:hypothetical protein|nr:DUF3768 domain-containing protein [Saprospiraceae bacterium]